MSHVTTDRGFKPVKVKRRSTTTLNMVVLLEIGADLWGMCYMTDSGVDTGQCYR